MYIYKRLKVYLNCWKHNYYAGMKTLTNMRSNLNYLNISPNQNEKSRAMINFWVVSSFMLTNYVKSTCKEVMF